MKVRYRQTFFAVSLVLCDAFMLLAGLKGAFWLRFESGWIGSTHGTPEYHAYSQAFALVLAVLLMVFRAKGLYQESVLSTWLEETGGVIRATVLTFFSLIGLSFFYRGFSFSRGYLLTALAVVPLFLIAGRVGAGFVYVRYRRRVGKFKEVLLVGANSDSVRYALRNSRQPRRCTRIVGLLDERRPIRSSYKRIRVLGHSDNLESVLNRYPHLNEIVVTSPQVDHRRIVEMMMLCEKHLVGFKWAPDLLGIVTSNLKVRYEMGLTLLCYAESRLMEWENRLLKRAVDMALSFAALLAVTPLMTVIAAWVKADSKGPVFYGQERVGEDGRVFKIYKFRTMKVGAEDASGPVWAKVGDPRRTGAGAFLRRFNLDELPQLWNVLRGDMSLVGPRPERPHFVGQFKENIPRYMGRHQIKSGITGWAQVNGLRGDTSIEERTKYDLYYIENWSLWLDFKILARTAGSFRNAY